MNNKEYFKKFNSSKAKVLASLVSKGPSSRKNLADELHLTRAFLTKLTTKMLEEKLILTGQEMNEGKVGRKQVMLKVNNAKGYFLGVHIAVDHISVRCSDFALNIVAFKRFEFSQLSDECIDEVLEYIKGKCECHNVHSFLKVSLLVRGSVLENKALDIQVQDVKAKFEFKLGQEVHLINNIVALSSSLDFSSKTGSNYILVKYGPGVGSLVISNSSILLRANGRPVEIGHIQIDPSSPYKCEICHKNGCLESEIGFSTLTKIASDGKSSSSDFSILEKYLEDDDSIMKEALTKLTIFISEAYDIFEPCAVFLTGEPFVQEKYRNYVYKAIEENDLNVKNKLSFIYDYIDISSRESIVYAFERYLDTI